MNRDSALDELIEDLFRQAEGAARSGDVQAARQIYEAVLQIDPQNEHALGVLGLSGSQMSSSSASSGPERGVPAFAERPAATNWVPASAARAAAANGAPTSAASPTPLDRAPAPTPPALETSVPAPLAPPAPVPAPTPLALETSFPAPETSLPAVPPAAPAPEIYAPAPAAALAAPEGMATAPAIPSAASVTHTQPVPVARPQNVAPLPSDGTFRIGPQTETARAIPPVAESQPGAPERAAAGGAQTEASPLLTSIREELAQGHLLEARRLANRALALPGGEEMAKSLLEEIRTHVETAAREAETLLAQGIAEFERGRMGVAMELLQQALARDPSHPVVQDYLARAEAARTGPDEDGPDFGLEQEADMKQSGGPTATATDAEKAPGAEPAAPPPPTLESPTQAAVPEDPVDAVHDPRVAAAVSALGAAPAVDAPVAPPAPAPRAPRSTKLTVSAKGGSGLGKLIAGLVILVVVAAGGWFGGRQLGFWGPPGAAAATSSTVANGSPDKPAHHANGSTTAPASSKPAATAPTPVRDSAAAVPPRSEQFDVKELLARAQAAMSQGREDEAVSLLTLARERAPENFDVLDRLEQARTALRDRTSAQERVDEGKARWAEENFADALRVFYRVPQRRQPAGLN